MAQISHFSRDAADPDVEAAPPPQVFTRTFSTPSGPPWEQARAAALEACHGAPLPLAEVSYRLRRLEPWTPGKAGRYAAFYVREREFSAPFKSIVEVDGRPIEVEFRARGDRGRQARAAAGVGAVLVAALILAGGGAFIALRAQATAEDRLATAERAAAAKLRLGHSLQRLQDSDRRLRAAQGGSTPVGRVLDDLAWASSSRAADSRIAAVHWEHGVIAVEVRDAGPPFPQAEPGSLRAGGQIRPGIFLWAIRPPHPPGASAAGASGNALP